MAKKLIKIPQGFIARKAGVEIKYFVETYDIGYYIHQYVDGKIKNITTRNTISKVVNYLKVQKTQLEIAGGWTIEDLEIKNFRNIDPKKLKFTK